MNRKIVRVIVSIVIIVLIIGGVFFIVGLEKGKSDDSYTKQGNDNQSEDNSNIGMNIVLSLEDKISDNTAWCGTFNLIWNDLKNDLAKRDIVFTPQLKVVENLNKGTFLTKYVDESSYYKVYGHPTLKLKKEIEDAIKEKFNETSDILNDFDWEENEANSYFLYAMLKKEFEFPKEFTQLANGKFKNNDNVEYFGINSTTDEQVRQQVKVLYYNSKDDFAVRLLTKGNDEIILAKGNKNNTFGSAYEDIIKQSKKYNNNKNLIGGDILKIPNIEIDLKKEFEEIEDKTFLFSNGEEYIISKAVQTIKFELDKKGGKIKSEAGMMINDTASLSTKSPREFILDDTFMIFLIENQKELPYFAAKISDITNM